MTDPQLDLDPEPAPAGDKAPKATKAASSTTKKAASSTPKKAASSTTKKAPRRKSTPRGGRPSKDSFRQLCADMVDQLVGVLTLAGFTSPRIAYDAQVIGMHADALTDELFARGWDAKAGRTNRFGQWMERAESVGQWGQTASLIVGIGLPLAANHGLLPTESVALVNIARKEPLPVPEPRPAADDGQADDAAPVDHAAAWMPATAPTDDRFAAWPGGDAGMG